jgi:aminoglycoside phosphotransferase
MIIGLRTSLSSSLASGLFRLLGRIWVALPRFIRASVYDGLLWAGFRRYGPSLSMTVYKLPFGLYLRRGSPVLAAKYQVEAHTLRMVEQFTHVPAPRAIDMFYTPRFSYLLMTCVPGRPIGQMLDTMTDEQMKQAVIDLKEYVSQIRKIPNTTAEFKICNFQGGGILDWRIPDSQREQLRFKTEADFNKYLTDPFWDDIRKRAAVSHNIQHEIVFTHGDLNPRNILAENGKITGIVDWENAGWFPEYWEYTKAHYSVRSLIRWLADVVDQVFEGYRDELVVENRLSDLFGPF